MKITGFMIAFGDVDKDEQAGFELERDDGMIVTVKGLAESEVRALAGKYMLDRVTITLASAGDLPDSEGGNCD